VEALYISSVKKLRASFPKFVIFLGIGYSLWLLATTFLLPLGKGSFVGSVEIARLDNIIVLAAVLVFVIASFVEMKNVAEASADLVISYISHRGSVEQVRIDRVRRAFSITLFILPFTVAYFMFSKLLEQINPLLNTIIPIGMVIWVVVASILLAMVLGLELEEAASAFVKKLKRKKK